MGNWHTKTVEYTLHKIGSTDHGLSSEEAAKRLAKYGLNRLRVRGTPLWRKLVEPFMSVFMAVLFLAIILSIVTGHTLDAIIIGAIIAISAIVFYVQTFSTERVLRALKRYEEQTIYVMRDGDGVAIPSDQLVIGDVVLLAEGEKVPADLRLIYTKSVRADESMLTGESLPITKQTHALAGDRPVYEQTNMLFQGSYVVSGQSRGVVVATANDTEYGRLAELSTPDNERSPVQKKIDKLLQYIIIAITVLVGLVLILELWRGIELFEALRFVMAMAVSAVPEGLPIAIAVVLVLGMRRLAKYNALARSPRAIETIGVITTIASDKTGTLTKNKLSVQEVWTADSEMTRQEVARWTVLASNDSEGATDPLDATFSSFAHDMQVAVPRSHKLIATYPFDQDLAMSGNTWQDGDQQITVLKGAPEKMLRQSFAEGSAERKEAEKQLHHLTGQGYRVIGLATVAGVVKAGSVLADLSLDKLKFIGLMAVADELRPEAAEAIRTAKQAGITVRMITGDHAQTAFTIGKKLGLVEHHNQVMDCRTIDSLDERELRDKIRDIRVFARVVPEAKHRILDILKTQDITAMTGDGVNDVPALTNAHLGIAMGSGSQIAKEAGDIVLLDDNFASVVHGVEGGRVIFDNIRRMLFYLLSTSLGEVLVFVGALIVGLPLPLVAVQILWINLVTDTAFDIPLGLEPAEDNVMKRPPRKFDQPLLDLHYVQRFLIIALTMALTTLVIFWYFFQSHDLAYAQTIAFTVLVVAQWANAFNARSEYSSVLMRLKTPNRYFTIGLVTAVVLQLLVLFGPLAGVMHVVPVALTDLLVSSAATFGIIIVVGEAHKAYSRTKRPINA